MDDEKADEFKKVAITLATRFIEGKVSKEELKTDRSQLLAKAGLPENTINKKRADPDEPDGGKVSKNRQNKSPRRNPTTRRTMSTPSGCSRTCQTPT